jgi:hypothetical protein
MCRTLIGLNLAAVGPVGGLRRRIPMEAFHWHKDRIDIEKIFAFRFYETLERTQGPAAASAMGAFDDCRVGRGWRIIAGNCEACTASAD